ncbi:MAG: GNAT family N-acetyltransferase [Tsuneonella sp.]
MNLREATPMDVPELVTVGRQSFIDAFGHLYKADDLQSFLDDWRSPERFAAHVGDSRSHLIVAELDGAIEGYCLTVIGKGFDERPDPKPKHPAMLSQLYCMQSATGRGMGAALLENALAEARARECDAIQLSVYAENFGAQRFYQRYGFTKVADIDFWVGNHRDDEFLYELTL